MDFNIYEYKHEINNCSKDMLEELAQLLAEYEPERIDDFRLFWSDWFEDKIVGSKLTIVARDVRDSGHRGKVLGVVRFWQSPYCNNKWLIEGLQVCTSRRRQKIGKSMVEYGINLLRLRNIEQLYVHISRKNEASASLHQSIGFVKVASGALNSWGNFKEHIDEYCLKLELLKNNELQLP